MGFGDGSSVAMTVIMVMVTVIVLLVMKRVLLLDDNFGVISVFCDALGMYDCQSMSWLQL